MRRVACRHVYIYIYISLSLSLSVCMYIHICIRAHRTLGILVPAYIEGCPCLETAKWFGTLSAIITEQVSVSWQNPFCNQGRMLVLKVSRAMPHTHLWQQNRNFPALVPVADAGREPGPWQGLNLEEVETSGCPGISCLLRTCMSQVWTLCRSLGNFFELSIYFASNLFWMCIYLLTAEEKVASFHHFT